MRDDIPRSLRPKPLARIITILVLVVVLLYMLGPIYWLIVASTKSNVDIVASNGWWFANNNVAQNYTNLMGWTNGLFWRWVGNSILYSTLAGVLGTLLSVMAGYGLVKFRFRGRNAIQLAILGGLLMPVALLTVPLYMVLNSLGLTNTMWAVIIPCAVSPFGVFLGRVYADSSVPDEVLESARMDGAGELRIFFTIVVRLLAPAMVTIFLFIFVATWNNFLLPLMTLSSPEIKPVTLGLYGMMSYYNPQYGAVLQGALLGVIPLVILFLALQKYWQSGLAAGAVKG
ncbi:carbohydrate ABC transporter permease [uncultured Tessaracoccus sp.]|uniref:carbohydrate ABC transporter permease n=1 Tax=uncultured Tessaracoccus sp. TaxID=905023 RepID=UPI00345B7F62